MTTGFEPHETATSVQVADWSEGDGSLTLRRDVIVKQPEVHAEEILIEARSLMKCRRRLTELVDLPASWSDALLCAASCSIGIAGSAVLAGVALGSALGVFTYLVCLVVASGSGVAYSIGKRSRQINARAVAQDVLDELPDPDKLVHVDGNT